MPQRISDIGGVRPMKSEQDQEDQQALPQKGKLNGKSVKEAVQIFEQISLKSKNTSNAKIKEKVLISKPSNKALAERSTKKQQTTTSLLREQRTQKPPVKPKPESLKSQYDLIKTTNKDSDKTEGPLKKEVSATTQEPVYENTQRYKNQHNLQPSSSDSGKKNNEYTYDQCSPVKRFTTDNTNEYGKLNFDDIDRTQSHDINQPPENEYNHLNFTRNYTPEISKNHYAVPSSIPAEAPNKPPANHQKFYPNGLDGTEPDPIYAQIEDTELGENIYDVPLSPEQLEHNNNTRVLNEQLPAFDSLLDTLAQTYKTPTTKTKRPKKERQALTTIDTVKNSEELTQLKDLLAKNNRKSISDNDYKEIIKLTTWINQQLTPVFKLSGNLLPANTTLHLPTLSSTTPTQQKPASDLLGAIKTLHQKKLSAWEKAINPVQKMRGNPGISAKKAIKALNGIKTHQRFIALNELLEKTCTEGYQLSAGDIKSIQKHIAWLNKQLMPALKIYHHSSADIKADLIQLPTLFQSKR